MPAPIVYENARTLPIPAEDIANPHDGDKTAVIIRPVYVACNVHDDAHHEALKGTLWERVAEGRRVVLWAPQVRTWAQRVWLDADHEEAIAINAAATALARVARIPAQRAAAIVAKARWY